MAFVDLILDLACLLLWIKWRSLPFDPFNQRTPATLVGTLRRAAPSHFRRWHLLAAIGVILALRALLYRQIGPVIHWTGKVDFGVITLAFRSDWLIRTTLFSLSSFLWTLAVFHLGLLLFSILKDKSAAANPMHRLVRVQMGRMDAWPVWAKLISPPVAVALAWGLAGFVFIWAGILPRPVSNAHRLGEALVIGLGSYLVWKFVATALLVLHLLNTYIYFGRHPFWKYVNACAHTLLRPLRPLPWRAGKVDLAPVAGLILVLLAAEAAGRGLAWLYERLPL